MEILDLIDNLEELVVQAREAKRRHVPAEALNDAHFRRPDGVESVEHEECGRGGQRGGNRLSPAGGAVQEPI